MVRAAPYRHGGFRASEHPALGGKRVVDFSVNLNPLGPPQIVRDEWGRLFDTIVDYPSVEGEGLGLFYEAKYGIPPREFLAGNGSTEIIYLLPRVLGFKTALVTVPSFHDYARASTIAGARVLEHPLLRDGALRVPDAAELIRAMDAAEALWLGNPNNPTGHLLPRDAILEICRRCPEKWVIVDEAFTPFVDGCGSHSLLLVNRPKNLLVLHSLTKFYALAGIRMGGVIGCGEVIDRLRAVKEPWTVNAVAEKIAPLLLGCGKYEEETLSLLRAERERVMEGIARMEGLRPLVSPSANFVLCRWLLTENLDDLLRHLLSHGIYVRDCRNFPGLEGAWFRAALKRPTENDRLLSAVASFPVRAHD